MSAEPTPPDLQASGPEREFWIRPTVTVLSMTDAQSAPGPTDDGAGGSDIT